MLLFITFISHDASSQNETKFVNGKVKSAKNDVSNILIINLNSKNSTITDALGLFTIEVNLRDSIRFTAVQYLPKTIIITDTIFNKKSVSVYLYENIINLNEVTVTPYNLTGKIELDLERLNIKPLVTSSTLGLPNADIVKLTQSERLLLEADRGKYIKLATVEDHGKLLQIAGYLSLSVVINTHKIMNRVSGRSKSLEDRVTRDENLEIEKKIIALFSKQTMAENFGISENNIDGFLTYCLSQSDFSELSMAGNTIEIWNYLKDKSAEFNEKEFHEN